VAAVRQQRLTDREALRGDAPPAGLNLVEHLLQI
jgi:hypothetical protein